LKCQFEVLHGTFKATTAPRCDNMHLAHAQFTIIRWLSVYFKSGIEVGFDIKT